MPITFSLANVPPTRAEVDLLVLGVPADPSPVASVPEPLRTALGDLEPFMRRAGFTGKADETLLVPTGGPAVAPAALLVGVGPAAEVDPGRIRRAAAAAARRATKAATVGTTLLDAPGLGADRPAVAQALAEGFVLGGYRFLTHKSRPEPSELERVVVLGRGGARVQAALDRGALVAEAVAWARDLVNTPAQDKSPATFARLARTRLRGRGVRVEVMDPAAIRAARLGGVLGVGQGSQQSPRFVKATYDPPGARHTLALVGKGVVFDSGGLSLKTASGMETMKTDMSGAAAVLATMSVLAALGVRHRVVAYAPLVENMPSGSAIRPGDVLRIRNGKTVEVLNTDAEGRLILADALCLAVEDGADAIVDVATLTGACMVALGEKVAGLMGNHDAWRDQVAAAAGRAGERVWPLPLPADYRRQLDSEIADLKNIGGSYGGAITAGLFLSEFVGDVPWAHLDIAGPARAGADDGETPKGGTGFGVRTLIEVATRFRRP